MKQDRFVVIDNHKGVLIPIPQENRELTKEERDAKAEKLQVLLKGLIKQTVRETIKECDFHLLEEWKEYERRSCKRLEEVDKKQEQRWKELEKHFKNVDKSIRKKQTEGKRKKHIFF